MILQIIFNFNQYIIICLTGIRCIYSKIHCNIVNIQQGKPEFFNIQFVPLQCSDNVFIIEECLICERRFYYLSIHSGEKPQIPVAQTIVLAIPTDIDFVSQSIDIFHSFIIPILRCCIAHNRKVFGYSKIMKACKNSNHKTSINFFVKYYVKYLDFDKMLYTFAYHFTYKGNSCFFHRKYVIGRIRTALYAVLVFGR